MRPEYTGSVTILSPNLRRLPLLLAPALLLAAGCGSGLVTAKSASSAFSITPYTSSIDTNCTGCNATSAQGTPVHQFTATLAGGGAAEVTWSVQGGDATSGPGNINANGQYTPPSYLTADRAEVVVTATLNANPSLRTSSVVTVTPGFLQPLTPENAALGANGSLAVTGFLAEAGGSTGINFKLASSPAGESGGQGSLGAASCQRGSQSFTSCTVTYTAPASVQATDPTYVVATVGGASASSRAASVVLVNAAGVTSNPATHQAPVSGFGRAGQLGRQQRGLRHARRADCGLLQRHAGRTGRGCRKTPVPAEQQPRAGQKRSRQRGRRHRPAGADRQQLLAPGRQRRRPAGGLFDRLAAARLKADQRGRGDCPSHLARRGPGGKILELGAQAG